MNTYAEKKYSTSMLARTDIRQYAIEIWTPYLNIKDEWKSEFDSNMTWVLIHANDIYDLCIDTHNIKVSSFDNVMYKKFISNLIKPYNHYLVYNCHTHRTVIIDELDMAFKRDYDCNQYYVGGSLGGKVAVIHEFAQPYPMGAELLIIGLTDKEYSRFDNPNPKSIFNFIQSNKKTINPLLEVEL